MYTGADNFWEDIGQAKAWKGMETIDPAIYPGECGEITGSAGEVIPPKRDKTFVKYFSPDTCR